MASEDSEFMEAGVKLVLSYPDATVEDRKATTVWMPIPKEESWDAVAYEVGLQITRSLKHLWNVRGYPDDERTMEQAQADTDAAWLRR